MQPAPIADELPAELARLRAANERLAAENDRLRTLARTTADSAVLQAERAASLLGWAARNQSILTALHRSTFWHVTAPLRVLARMLAGAPEHGGRRGLSLRP